MHTTGPTPNLVLRTVKGGSEGKRAGQKAHSRHETQVQALTSSRGALLVSKLHGSLTSLSSVKRDGSTLSAFVLRRGESWCSASLHVHTAAPY